MNTLCIYVCVCSISARGDTYRVTQGGYGNRIHDANGLRTLQDEEHGNLRVNKKRTEWRDAVHAVASPGAPKRLTAKTKKLAKDKTHTIARTDRRCRSLIRAITDAVAAHKPVTDAVSSRAIPSQKQNVLARKWLEF